MQPQSGGAMPTRVYPGAAPGPAGWLPASPDHDAITEAGPLSFATGSVPPPGAAPPHPGFSDAGTQAFGPATPPGVPPFGMGMPPAGPPPASSAAPAPPGTWAPPPARPASPPANSPPTHPARQSQARVFILAAVAAIVLFVLIGGGLLFARSFNKAAAPVSGPQATARSTRTAGGTPIQGSPTASSPGLTTYQDPNGLYTIGYPPDWQVQQVSHTLGSLPLLLHGVRFQGGSASFSVLIGDVLPFVPDLASQADDSLLQLMGGQHISSARSVSIGGQQWTQKQAETITGSKLIAASITYNSHLYSIVYGAPDGEFAADDSHTFTPMLQSFLFNS
jgi:hypothetical protein